MKKTIYAVALTALMGTSSSVIAHNDVCNYSTDYNINIDEKSVVFSKNNGDKFEFIDNKLLINGDPVVLTDEQREASAALEKNARAMVPQIAEIAVEGAELGLKATTIVMTSLFGEDDPAIQEEIIAPIEALTEKIKANITTTSFNSQTLEKSFDEAFDEEFEQMIETVVTKHSGKLVSNVLAAVFSGDGEEMEDFSFRMETLERDIDTYVEANAADLEVKAEALCADIAALDKWDNLLESVDGYPAGGLIEKDGNQGFRFSGLNFGD